MFRLKMILRLLQMPSFNGKMSALTEVNQVIGSVLQQSKPDWLTPATIAVSIVKIYELFILFVILKFCLFYFYVAMD